MKPFQFLGRYYKKLLIIIGLIILLVLLFLVFLKKNPKHEIIRDAYIYGYPLVTMDMVRIQETNVQCSG